MRPPRSASLSSGWHICISIRFASTLTAMVPFQVWAGISWIGCDEGKMPALRTSMSMPPKRLTPRSRLLSIAFASVRSQVAPRTSTRGHSVSIAGFTSRAITAAPRASKDSTQALPIPAAKHRQRLGANHVIGRRRPFLRQALDLRMPREAEKLLGIVHLQYHGKSRLVGDRAPQARDLLASGGRELCRRKTEMPRFVLLQILLGQGHQADHPLVRLARVGAEGENAMRQQHHSNAIAGRLFRKFAGAVRGEIETGHY